MGVRMMVLGVAAVVIGSAGLLTTACSDDPARSARKDGATSKVAFALSGGDFTGNSIRICGVRAESADGKYRCNSTVSVPADDGGTVCPCFEFASDGAVLDPDGLLSGLCPSSDIPTADWTFTYEIWSATECGGVQLNDGTNNLTCFDAQDLLTQANPNQSTETLAIGTNTNQVLCITDNALKAFQFGSCATVPPEATESRYDCGCTVADAGGCTCPGGLVEGNLQAGCTFDPANCNIVCEEI